MDEEELYRQKYLKYKNKYLELKAQTGGQDLFKEPLNALNKMYKRVSGDITSIFSPEPPQTAQPPETPQSTVPAAPPALTHQTTTLTQPVAPIATPTQPVVK